MTAVPPTQDELTDKVALITGAARGIGRQVALIFAGRGAAVALVDRDEAGAEQVAAEVKTASGRAVAIGADLAVEEDVTAAFDQAASKLGPVNALVANHTLHSCGHPVAEIEPADWDRIVAANLRGTYLCAKAALAPMIELGQGSLVAISSDCVIRSCRKSAAYVASKAGVVALMRSVAIDHGPDGIRANVVTPGVTETPGLEEVYTAGRDFEESVARAAAQSPLGRLGQPEEVAEAVAFISSDRAKFITGAELLVDGGMTISYGGD